jgi:hypothetical protein
MCFDDDSAFGDGSEEIVPIEESLGMEVEEFEVLEEVGIEADVGEGLELDLVEEFGLEAG